MQKEYTKEEVRELIEPLITQIDFLMESRDRAFEFIISQANLLNYNKSHKFVFDERTRLADSDTIIGNVSRKLNNI
jgi:hypothetical protein